ncbi:MAG: hypothetical protein AUJ57_11320 [Zetaproteobacteria bacterium CG1_02_53_45]|nr:MAG: hypothetical protein AUJ57_11320 [Zetaproteobacteria bacterium CG1_02_53_45]
MPEAQRLAPGMRPDRRMTAGQQLQTKTVPSRAGDTLKMQARKVTPPAESKRVERIPPKTVARSELRPRPEPVAPTAVPVITFPGRGQRFSAPASVTAKADFDRRNRVQFLLKTVPDKRIVQRSSDGQFNNIVAVSYTV